ncbi:hypothetical protein ABE321_06445 [Bacillus paralicheniformis]|uniref:hypothetical protein n=1 Tax=Bacillus paralicheniformis TaxID=1648923 RepID=UPI0011AB609F|nr:hypothetical protein [Bacillus paralicheniformis]MBR8663089.1 hypothetical protein [Bacillus paralicheniformis]MEC1823653.1 hypothetical protein [Bacillus paralicheniformis]MED1221948.1 hypothetical protein [Bacillus paralicheniformis]MED1716045.1 hypothetical protein [Bacillus paralicheniformis]TWK25011.1 hypothetical protein CHCC20372_2539 [Bacillus paralicheniformis]
MKGRNKIILSVYSLLAAIVILTGLVKPSMNWKEKLAVIGFMFVSISLFAFITYVFINKPKKDQSAPRCNIVAKIFWKKYRKPFMLSFYFVGILIVGTSVFFMPELSLAWKSGVFAILFAVISGGFFTVYQAANQMLNRSCLERMPDEE